ncbi:unnamed protein product [Paramecium sonneborni]|uniref:Uncharacterized protein n=1 Tax=Paramecium sonneborni TaxID=65129 RepID=A0A8S1KYU6_9CILI|nr:unnamed protein product [Paramecium sonneborni]
MQSNWQNVFNWIPVSGILINQENENIQIDLQTQQKAVLSELKLEIFPDVIFKKQLNYDLESGWSWHKSWNLPEIDYILNVPISSQQNQGIFFVQIFVVKALQESQQYKNLGIKGESKKQIINQQTNFRCLKFTTTSYKNDHQKFHLMFVLFYSPVNKENVVISSIISPQIFVDSRKFARFHTLSVPLHSFTELFPYDLLDAIIIKRETKNKTFKMIKVDNSITGFINYFTASNIRNKIKHPIFLALRFSSLIKIFVDQQLFYQQTNIVGLIQNHLNNIINKEEKQKKIKLLIKPHNQDNIIQKRAIELIQQLENSCYEIYTQQCYLPDNVKPIEDLQYLSQQYSEFFKQSQANISKTKNFTILKTQSCSYIEDHIATKVKIEQFQKTINQPQQTFRNQCDIFNQIKKEEVKISKEQFKQIENQQDVHNMNINQSQLYSQLYLNQYQNSIQYQQFQNQYYNPYQFANPCQTLWRNI